MEVGGVERQYLESEDSGILASDSTSKGSNRVHFKTVMEIDDTDKPNNNLHPLDTEYTLTDINLAQNLLRSVELTKDEFQLIKQLRTNGIDVRKVLEVAKLTPQKLNALLQLIMS